MAANFRHAKRRQGGAQCDRTYVTCRSAPVATLERRTIRQLHLKMENMQRTGSYKDGGR